MVSWLPLLLCVSGSPAACPGQATPVGRLCQPAYAADGVCRPPAVPYEPQPGDLFIFNSSQLLWKGSFCLALSGPPTHTAIVVGTPDGQMCLLEAGIGFVLSVELSPIRPRLAEYHGQVYVRRRKIPLSAAESAQLTEFALAVHKKRVSPLRFIAQVTPLRARGPLRTPCVGKPRGVQQGYICSELVVEACVAAGLLDAETARPRATYPRDLFFDHSSNWYLNRHLNLSCGWYPPALWTDEEMCPCTTPGRHRH